MLSSFPSFLLPPNRNALTLLVSHLAVLNRSLKSAMTSNASTSMVSHRFAIWRKCALLRTVNAARRGRFLLFRGFTPGWSSRWESSVVSFSVVIDGMDEISVCSDEETSSKVTAIVLARQHGAWYHFIEAYVSRFSSSGIKYRSSARKSPYKKCSCSTEHITVQAIKVCFEYERTS